MFKKKKNTGLERAHRRREEDLSKTGTCEPPTGNDILSLCHGQALL